LSSGVVERVYPFAKGGIYELIAGKDPQGQGGVLVFFIVLTRKKLGIGRK